MPAAIAPAIGGLTSGDHVCWVFDDETTRLDTLAAYVGEGLRRGHQVLCLADPAPADRLTDEFERRAVPAAGARDRGQLDLVPAEQSYLRSGSFDPAAMGAGLRSGIADARSNGYQVLWLAGDMTWAVEAGIGAEEIAQYEQAACAAFFDGHAVALCQYDRRLFSSEQLAAIVSAHPAAALGELGRGWQPMLRISMEPGGPLRLVGQADTSNCRALETALAELVERNRAMPATVDANELSFMDVRSCRALFAAARRADRGLRITGCTPATRHLLRLMGYDSVPELVVDQA